MLNIGERIIQLRKSKNWSQEDLAKEINASRIMIGKYERNDNSPSVEVLVKLAQIFEVSIDYLVGQGKNATFDHKTLQRLEEMEQLSEQDKQKIFDYLDLIIRDNKTRKAYS